MRLRVHPDGRHFVRDPDPESLAQATTDVYCTVDASELASYLALGFDVHRREDTYLVPVVRCARLGAPAGFVFAQADEVDEAKLRLLDNELRQDVPGAEGWHWGADAFHAETYEATDFDPTTYLIALDSNSQEYVGIVRVWMKDPIPRLGFIGVRRRFRRRGIAAALVAEVFARLEDRGVREITTEIDETNTASRALFEGLGACRTGTSVELIKRYVEPR